MKKIILLTSLFSLILAFNVSAQSINLNKNIELKPIISSTPIPKPIVKIKATPSPTAIPIKLKSDSNVQSLVIPSPSATPSVSANEPDSDAAFHTLQYQPIIQVENKNLEKTNRTININFKEKLSPELIDKIEKSETNPGDILNQLALQQNLVSLSVEEKLDGNLLYKISAIDSPSFFEDEPDISKELVSLSTNKKIQFHLNNHTFTINEKEEFDYSALNNNNLFIGIDLKNDSNSKNSHFKVKPKGNCLEIFLDNNSSDKIDLCNDFQIEPDGAYLVDGAKKLKLENQPDLIFNSIRDSVEKENSKIISTTLKIEKEKPLYQFQIEEKHKLFWIIPINIRADLEINAENSSISNTKYGLSGLLFKDKKYINEFKFGPNLVFENVTLEPKSLHNGDKLKINARIKNIGNKYASAGYTSEIGPSSVDLFFGNDLKINSIETGFFIFPGESINIPLEWTAILCNVPITIKIDPENKIEETNKTDNIWQYDVKCAPSDAPDLTIDSISYDGNTKRIGSPNNIHFTFKNNGTQIAPESTALYSYDGQMSSILVPTLAVGEKWSTERIINPKSCDPVKLELDVSDNVNEFNEDNNIGYDPGEITDTCKKRPDLFIDNTWWKTGGYSFGDIYAGEEIWFEYRIKNDPILFYQNEACINGFNVALKLNGQIISSQNLPKIGCIPSYGYSNPDYWIKIGHFTYTPKCNGEKLTIEVDPANAISESKENNNTWTLDIVCTLPPPIVD